MKKIAVVFAVAAVVVLASCSTHRTCPTYLKKDVKTSDRA